MARLHQSLHVERTLSSASSGPVILVVEDNKDVRKLLEIALRGANFTVRSTGNGQEAIQIFQRENVDLVLLDVQMPGLDGPQTFANLRLIKPRVPCCFMTGHAGRYTCEDLLQMGAARVFQKPFLLEDLRRAILDVIAQGKG